MGKTQKCFMYLEQLGKKLEHIKHKKGDICFLIPCLEVEHPLLYACLYTYYILHVSIQRRQQL